VDHNAVLDKTAVDFQGVPRFSYQSEGTHRKCTLPTAGVPKRFGFVWLPMMLIFWPNELQ
jgi:hypothetical protein